MVLRDRPQEGLTLRASIFYRDDSFKDSKDKMQSLIQNFRKPVATS
jgi:hypothetical protein